MPLGGGRPESLGALLVPSVSSIRADDSEFRCCWLGRYRAEPSGPPPPSLLLLLLLLRAVPRAELRALRSPASVRGVASTTGCIINGFGEAAPPPPLPKDRLAAWEGL